MESNKLYVGNLNYKATPDDVKNVFSEYGEVLKVQLITDKETGRLKGYGFVEFATSDEAAAAKNALSDQDFMQRRMKIDFANPKTRN